MCLLISDGQSAETYHATYEPLTQNAQNCCHHNHLMVVTKKVVKVVRSLIFNGHRHRHYLKYYLYR